MNRTYAWLVGATLLAAGGCSARPADLEPAAGGSPATGAPAAAYRADASPVTAIETGGAAAEPAAPADPTRDPDRDFTPSDPAGVTLAAGRPQLIEFFAHW